MNSPLWNPLFQALVRIEKKLDEVMREQKGAQDASRIPGLNIPQGLSQPGQNPCGLCGKIPSYRKIGIGDTVTLRFCECDPHIEDI